MPDLATHQHAFARALRDRNNDSIAPLLTTDAASSARRLGIYRANSIAGATKALVAAYPVIAEVVGSEFFDALARAYWHGVPSRSGDLGDYGDTFASFLVDFEHVADMPWLADLARLEWAVHRASLAADATPFDAATLASVPPAALSSLILELVPGTTTIASRYPIVHVWTLHQPGTDRSAGFAVDWNLAETGLVTRQGIAVRVVAIDPPAAIAIEAMQQGATLADALAAGQEAARRMRIGFDPATAPAVWLADGLFAGYRFDDHFDGDS